ncbi:hypothetical protein MXB_660, partial [Myxobolus squamalis]
GLLYVKQERYEEALEIYENNQNDIYNMPYDQIGQWHKASRVDKSIRQENHAPEIPCFKQNTFCA